MTLTAYFDESGTHKDSHVVAVAGFIASDESWAEFSTEWVSALTEFKLPFFHMADFAAKAPGYRWPEELRRGRLQRLLSIIVNHVGVSVGTAIPTALYKKNVVDSVDRLLGGPYGMAAASCFLDLGDIVRPTAESIACVFERGAEGVGEVTKSYRRLTRDKAFRQYTTLASLSFEDKRKLVPLQAADILAYELHRRVQTQLGLDARPRRNHPLAVLSQRPNAWVHFKEGALKDWSRALSKDTTGWTLNVKPDGGLEARRPDGSLYVAGDEEAQ